MSISVTSPITGGAQTGLTSPTYTVVTDTAPPGNPGKQVAVTALGGTQAGWFRPDGVGGGGMSRTPNRPG
jgi:hypothetical protein